MLSQVEDELELLERHIKVLKLVAENEPVGIIKLSSMSNIPQHKIRYSLRLLENQGVIRPSSKGAVTTEKAKRFFTSLPDRIDKISTKVAEIRKMF